MEALLRRVIATKYVEDKWGWWPVPGLRYRRSSLWGAIVSVGDASYELENVLSRGAGLWGPLRELFPMVIRVVSNKESTIYDHYEVREGCTLWGCVF